jgi:hypothetical protein
MRYKDHPDRRIRQRFEWEARQLKDVYCAALWAMERHLRETNRTLSENIRSLRKEIETEFGALSRAAAR